MSAAREGAPQIQASGVASDLESTSELPVLDAAGIEAFAQDEDLARAPAQCVPIAPLPGVSATLAQDAVVADALLLDVQRAHARSGAPARPPASPRPAAVAAAGADEEIGRLRSALQASEARATRYLEQLQTRQGRTAVVDSVYLELQAQVEARAGVIARLEREIELAHSRAVELQGELRSRMGRAGELERALATHSADARTTQGELLARLSAAEAAVQERDAQIEELREAVRAQQDECKAALTRREELESDLRAAEDAIHRLEAELRNRSVRLGELERARQEPRPPAADVQHARTDVHLERQVREARPEGARRMLVRSDGGAEVVHVLARKTSIGRTLDNDVQVEASFVSRHHAVVLAGPASTVIEDLNSTNGVLVNGHRVTRQTLADGDEVVIGRTRFRFAVR